MDHLERFGAYAAAFEETYADDDWGRLDEYFTENAVYTIAGDEPFQGRFEGRANLLQHLRESVNGFDRRFHERVLELRGEPRRGPDSIEIAWRATYRKKGAPDLVIEGSERATFEGDRIALLEDQFESGAGERVSKHVAAHLPQE